MLKEKSWKALTWVLILVFLFSNFIGVNGSSKVLAETNNRVTGSSTDKTFDFIEITDFHGQLLDSTGNKQVGAVLAKAVKDIKSSNPDRTLIIGGGDLYQGTPVSNVLHGVPVQQMMTNIGMEVTALGNHEFDWGLDVIDKETMDGAGYAVVCANMYSKLTAERRYNPYKIITKDGVKIAVIGAILKDAPTIILPANVESYTFTDVATEVNSVASEIREKKLADIVVATIHDGGDSLNDIVSKLKGVDVVFGGHTHTSFDKVLKDADGKDVPTLNGKSTGQGYIDLKVTVKEDKTLSFSTNNYKSITVTDSTPVDPEVKAIVDKANENLKPIFSKVIGKNEKALTKDQMDQPYGESQLGNWMSDVIKNYAKADVGMQNNGGIRLSPIPAGDITVGTIFYLMPFDNTVCTVNMTGAQLKVLLEQAVQDNGKGIQISGVKFVYDSTKPSYKPAVLDDKGNIVTPEVMGERVTSIVRESDNSPIKGNDILKVAAPDFMATGGDTFTEFSVPEIKATFNDSHHTVRDALLEDVTAKGKITVVMNNRVDNQKAAGPTQEVTISKARIQKSGTVAITGTVSIISGKNVFMQETIDGVTSGICVYNSAGAAISKGDKIKVTGPLSEYKGLLEITPASAANVQIISKSNMVTAKSVKVNELNETLEGQYVKLSNVTLQSIDNTGSSIIQDETGSIAIYKMPILSGIAAGDKVDVTAAVSQFSNSSQLNDGYQLMVGAASDIVKAETPPVHQNTSISIVATSDVHGNVLNFDYGTNAAPTKGQGLAKVSTYVKSLKAANPNVMLIDNGDTIQGTPLVYYYNMVDKTSLHPMAAAMGAMGYDTETLGNHEFNYGLDTLNRVIKDYRSQNIHVLSANTYKSDGSNYVEPYFIKSFNANGKTTKVGVLGLTTKTIASWEDPAHYSGLQFNDLVEEAKKWVPKMRAEGANIVIVAAHSGEEGASDVIPENQIKALATGVAGIDGIIAGHAHSTFVHQYTNPEGKSITVLEPGKWANTVSQIDINMNEEGVCTSINGKNVAMDNSISEDPAILSVIASYQTKTLEYTATVLGSSEGEYKGDKQTIQPTEIMELINKVQAQAAGAQMSIAAPLNSSAYIPKGNITIQNVMGVYVYENFLYGIKMNGAQLKKWMEYSVRYYKQVANASDPIAKDSALNIPDYNLDQLYGATYDIDLTQPAGNRIKNLKYKGKMIKDTDVFTVAINNYRFNGGGGFMAAAGLSNTDPSIVTYDSAKKLGDDGQVRSLMMKYIQECQKITPTTENNWKIYTTPVSEDVHVTGISLDKTNVNLEIGNTVQIIATITPEEATNKSVVWKSENPSIASVKDNGEVTAVSAGNTTISATTVDGSFTASSTITVKAPVVIPATGIQLNKRVLDLKDKQSETLIATVLPSNATNKKVIWKSSDPSVATVDENGKVTGSITSKLLLIGVAKITATTADGKYSDSALVRVERIPVFGIRLDKNTATIGVGEKETLIPTIFPEKATNKNVIWKSDNTEVATVSESGEVYGKAIGKVKITVTTVENGFKDSCEVTVIAAGTVPVSGIQLNKKFLTLKNGESSNLIATVMPSTATNKKMIWKSSNSSIATVDENGKVTAAISSKLLVLGIVKITATTVDGNYKDEAIVTVVKVPVKGVRLNKGKVTIQKGKVEKLEAMILNSDATIKDIQWKSEDPSVVSVDSNGKVMGITNGTTQITVTTIDGGFTATCEVTSILGE